MKKIVLITGFESFNTDLYRQSAVLAMAECAGLQIDVFSDRHLLSDPDVVEASLKNADVFFASLIFDYEQVIWLRERVAHIPIRLVFESALELMSLTQLGKFVIGEQPKGMPKPIKFILSKFSSGKEEDKLAGYISFLKIGPKLLKFIPGQKVQDLRNWLIIYSYWNAGGQDNVTAMFWLIGEKYLQLNPGKIPELLETPNMGLLHPDYQGYFDTPKKYLTWYDQQFPDQRSNPVIAILLYRKHVITQQNYIPQLIKYFDQAGLKPVPIFINGVEAHVAVRDWLTTETELNDQVSNPKLSAAVKVDGIVSTIGFPLVGGPAGSMEAGRQIAVAQTILTRKNIPYLIAAPLLIQDLHSWTRQGIGGLQGVVLYALPELDGAIDTIPLGGLVGDQIYLIPERVQRLIGRLKSWVKLRQTPTGDRQIAIILYGFPPGYGATGTAALLNVPRSLVNILTALQKEGYDLGNIDENLLTDGEAIINLVRESEKNERSENQLSVKVLEKRLGYLLTKRLEKYWGELRQPGIKNDGENCQIGGVQFGKIWIGVQPALGIAGDPMRLMFERDLTPHPQYVAFYNWLAHDFAADAIIHLGMHGTVEWLPGSPLGNTAYSWSDILLSNLPNLYIYAANNPSESILAKRRGYGVLISHNVPPYGRAGLYKELINLRDLINEYRQDTEKNYLLKDAIWQKIIDTGLNVDCPLELAKQLGIEFTLENIKLFSNDILNQYFSQVYEYLQVVEQRLFSAGLHTLGANPTAEELKSYLQAYFNEQLSENLIDQVLVNNQNIHQIVKDHQLNEEQSELLKTAGAIKNLLNQNTDEITNLLRGLNGEYIPATPGGDLLRDGPGVLPTGRNIHALDPYRMPSAAAYLRGREIAQKIIAQHLQENDTYPETVAVMLWGLDAIKTKGESLGILLELVGAEPVKEGTGRIVRYELQPLSQINHPRIDVIANLSGIFRDSFLNIIELLDDLFLRASQADEPIEQNFIRKHALVLQGQGIDNISARLFSNPAGDYGSLVNDRVVDGNWENSEDLANTWLDRNAFSYGRKEQGTARKAVLQELLKGCDRIVQEIDSVEYGLTDIQEYYANTGALKKAAETRRGNKKVSASFIESFSKDTNPRNLEDLLRLEYRTKLLNPQWAEAMVDQGSGGAYEISQRMTALIGWGGTTNFTDNWVYDQATATYALDEKMAKKLRQANPEAFKNIVGRMLEAHGRGFWHPQPDVLERLQQLYELIDEELEGVNI